MAAPQARATSKHRATRRISSFFSSASSASDTSSLANSDSVRSAQPSSRLAPEDSIAAWQPPPPPARKLTKERERVVSHHSAPAYPPPPPPPATSLTGPPTITPVHAEPASTLQPPSISTTPPLLASQPPSRANSRPQTPITGNLIIPETLPVHTHDKKAKRKSFLFGARGSSDHVHEAGSGAQGPLAWVIGHQGKVQYNLSILMGAEKVPELWDEHGDTFVYLFPRNSGKGPSFRVDSSIYSSSPRLTKLAFGRLYSEGGATRSVSNPFPPRLSSRPSSRPASRQTSRPVSPDQSVQDNEVQGSSDGSKGSRTLSDTTDDIPTETHLYIPIALSTDTAPTSPNAPEQHLNTADVDKLIAYRNFFAFLLGQSLVATERNSSMFDIFLRISDILEYYEFSNLDGSSYGEVAAGSFDSYVDELHLADVRKSREKTIEAIVLGERMRSTMLYNEGFVHGAGRWEEIKKCNSPKFHLIKPVTLNRIERASMDLEDRLKTVTSRLEDFDFPSIFAGIMNSKMAEEGKIVHFEAWKTAFLAARKHVYSYYKHKYGSWPPKASSKKNNLEISGMNRLVLLDLYHDVSCLYDLLVDRNHMTTRTADGLMEDEEADDIPAVTIRALRKALSEYDRSSPPVQPPVPFDVPRWPSLKGVKKDYGLGDEKKDTKARNKKLKEEEIFRALENSYNKDSILSTPFLDRFREFERKAAKGKTLQEICDLRTGQWMFMYAVIQALPMVVIDASGIHWTDGVEYFLCQPPRSGVPWAREDLSAQRSWFGVAGTSNVIHLPADVVEHGVEAIYLRSHCWQMSHKWTEGKPMMAAALLETMQDSLLPEPGLLQPPGGMRTGSPDRRRESVMNLGLEALPVPAGAVNLAMRPASSNDPTKTFDAILESTAAENAKAENAKHKNKGKKNKK
ncbi:uncharacterized protein BDZ99DRAFT_494145 [Mytilinidion resinicola]|uniref:DUF8004 domain-containing protein n=1 Tax=Mytilinidion resinicola TaxID=574789 RepID=A0A6A6Z7W3_9PEZI|nr:uncharacterized protein BDZ99DRAFT_494145 [Mytilinidion resinicola]KAF2816297.1 hypothetical protein BDZ99DRAFT_494145 [Mytilinidion resinicola]